MGVPINNVSRRVVYAASGTGPYAFTFEILAAADIAVYKDDTLLTLTTDYTVTINANGTGSITLTASPTGATQIAIVGNRTIQRLTDFVTGGDLFANTINDELDQQTIFAQQNAEGLDRSLKAPQTDPTSINMTLPRASVRANKTLAFDANGNPTTGEVIGDNRGNWAAGTAYNKRDIVKDTSNGNIYYANTAHTSSGSQPISSNADSAKWDLIVDNAAAGASASAAAASASAAASSASAASTSASNASSSASSAASSASAASTSASNASTSATNAASSASTASTQASNAATSATNAANSATSASNSASTATTQATNASNSASSASTSATNAANSASSASSSASSASSSASSASTSASNAASSATAAAASATSAAASYDSFDDRYLGAKTSDPTLDNDGNALLTGALYFNSSTGEMKVYSGSAWVSSFLTTGAQTFTGVKTFASNPILDAGTANGVAYLNGSKVLTTGSALTFDGTNLTVPAEVYRTSDTSYLRLSGGNGPGTGANVLAFGTTHATAPGRLSLTATGTGQIQSYSAGGDHVWSIVSEQMRLTSTGLGIGTSSPAYKLDVKASGAFNVARFTGQASSVSTYIYTDTAYWWFGDGASFTGQGYTGHAINKTLSLYTDSVERVFVGATGNVGIGTSSVLSKLVVSNGSAKNLEVQPGATTYLLAYDRTASDYLNLDISGKLITFSTNNGSERMRLDSSGNLGLGVSSPNALMTVYQYNGVTTNSNTANSSFGIGPGGAVNPIVGVRWTNTAVGISGSQFVTQIVNDTANSNALEVYSTGASPIVFGTNSTERARITSGGDLLVGVTSPLSGYTDAYLHVPTVDGGKRAISIGNSAGSSATGAITFLNSNGTVGYILTSGTTTTYATSSDYRLKNITGPITNSGAYIDSLRPVEGTWKADGSTFVGLIAHEVQEVSRTNIATGTKDGEQMQGMDYSASEIIANLIAELQSLRARLAAAGI